MSITLTGKTIGQLTTLTGITEDTLFPVELSGTTYKIPYTKVKQFTHYLGEQYLGGIIFNLYTASDGQQHGHVVSLTETITSLQDPTSLVGADSTWDGATNTSLYTNSLAKTWVESLGEGWYIPSIDEINTVYNNRYHVNKAISALGSGTLLSNTLLYWSSTEDGINVAWSCNFDYGITSSSLNKTTALTVRAVKSF